MFTTAGSTPLTTGANVAGIVAASRTAGAAAATMGAGAWPACIIEAPTKAPPAVPPRHSIIATTIHIWYLLIRFISPNSPRQFQICEVLQMESDGTQRGW